MYLISLEHTRFFPEAKLQFLVQYIPKRSSMWFSHWQKAGSFPCNSAAWSCFIEFSTLEKQLHYRSYKIRYWATGEASKKCKNEI